MRSLFPVSSFIVSSHGWGQKREQESERETEREEAGRGRVQRERERERGSSLISLFIRTVIPFKRAPPSCPDYLPKTPPPNSFTLGVRISTYEFGDANIQSITLRYWKYLLLL